MIFFCFCVVENVKQGNNAVFCINNFLSEETLGYKKSTNHSTLSKKKKKATHMKKPLKCNDQIIKQIYNIFKITSF